MGDLQLSELHQIHWGIGLKYGGSLISEENALQAGSRVTMVMGAWRVFTDLWVWHCISISMGLLTAIAHRPWFKYLA